VLCRQCHQLRRLIINLFLMRVTLRTGAPASIPPSKTSSEGFRWVNQTKVIRAVAVAAGDW